MTKLMCVILIYSAGKNIMVTPTEVYGELIKSGVGGEVYMIDFTKGFKTLKIDTKMNTQVQTISHNQCLYIKE
jgi:hypothetical protein